MSSHVIADVYASALLCRHCAASESLRGAGDDIPRRLRTFRARHAACPRPETLAPMPTLDSAPLALPDPLARWPGLQEWMRAPPLSPSAIALTAAITGLTTTPVQAVPFRADDFRRCVDLLAAVPTLRPGLHTSSTRARLARGWHGILDRWSALEALAVAGQDAHLERLLVLARDQDDRRPSAASA